ncbi:putative tricarboxylic transport membrane protein [Litoreibacter ascidiaceicola]|uniref:Putative tricarboxylic transport membrane protein n=1 Tax=Litoreibacter ascidiaceicola TaxID=1486859 RepID=A0A1M4Z4W1_9RHOB|nr:tripartite tricarboxylate transporter TctB family protein [Litoreibacter ascidiaceicola]SHF13094.1 putative tricarboxylic transport membrane protein [Litoreibacter ascidiaceicola]
MASDRIFGLVTLITAVAYLAAATQIQTNLFSGEFLPKLFPMLIGGVAALCSLFMIFKPDPEPDWPASGSWIAMGVAIVVLAIYAVLLKPLGFILPTIFAAGILSYQISPRAKPAMLAGIGLSLGLFVLFKFALGLGNIVAYRIPTPAKLWDAISILIPFVGH